MSAVEDFSSKQWQSLVSEVSRYPSGSNLAGNRFVNESGTEFCNGLWLVITSGGRVAGNFSQPAPVSPHSAPHNSDRHNLHSSSFPPTYFFFGEGRTLLAASSPRPATRRMSGRSGAGQIRGATLGPQPLKATVPYQLATKPRSSRRDGKSGMEDSLCVWHPDWVRHLSVECISNDPWKYPSEI